MNLDEKLKVIQRPDATIDELSDALHDLGEEGDPNLHPYVAPFLDHPDPALRNMALNVLGFHWALPQYSEKFAEMLSSDPEEGGYARQTAASCLGFVLRGTRDKRAAKLLITKVKDDSEEDNVREAAYDALLQVWAPDSTQYRGYSGSLLRRTNEGDRLLEKASEAREKGDKATALSLIAEAEDHWKKWVDWKLVDAIEREVHDLR